MVRLLGDAALSIVLHEEAQAPLASLDLPPTGEIVLVVGPEGGIAQTELDAFAAVGVVAVRLGPEAVSYTHLDVYKRQGEPLAYPHF